MKYKCCHILKHGLCFFEKELVSCCYSPNDQVGGGKPPIIIDKYNGELFSKEFLFKKINEKVNIFKSGNIPKECQNCYHIEEKEWDDDSDEYIDYISITHFSYCQADCIYCSNNMPHLCRTNNVYKIMPILKHLKEQGIIKKNVEFHIGGGEFSIYPECDELIDEFAFSDFAVFYLPTNAIHYSEKIQKALSMGSVQSIIVSLDSGCKKTFKKIKRIDAFDKVVKNIKKYSDNGNIQGAISLKYIIIPSVNDNYSEFKKFLKVAKTVNADVIIIDIDARYSRLLNYNVDEYLIHFAYNLKNISENSGFNTKIFSFIKQCENKGINKNSLTYLISYIKYKFFNKTARKLYKQISK